MTSLNHIKTIYYESINCLVVIIANLFLGTTLPFKGFQKLQKKKINNNKDKPKSARGDCYDLRKFMSISDV